MNSNQLDREAKIDAWVNRVLGTFRMIHVDDYWDDVYESIRRVKVPEVFVDEVTRIASRECWRNR